MASSFVDFAEDSDVHGIKQITRVRNGQSKRFLWFLFMMGSVGMFASTVTIQVIYFFTFDHTTKYDVNFVHQLDFPAVTICNINHHRRSAMTLEDIAVMGSHLGFTDEHYNLKHPEMYPEDWYNETFLNTDWEAIASQVNENEYNLTEFYERTGHQYDDLVQYCQWKANKCNRSSWDVDYTHYGRCYTFNKHGDHMLLKAGAGNGLQLVLYGENDEYIQTTDTDDLGIKFLPHSPIEPPFLKELGFGLAPGYHYLIGLKEKSIIGLPEPYGVCEQDHETLYYKNYTVAGCRIECETELIYDRCGCRLVESPGNHPVCSPKMFPCAEQVLESIEQSDECLCQNPCKAIQYPYTFSMLEIRETTIDKLKKEHPVPEHLNRSMIISMNIYFETLSSETAIQVPAYHMSALISDLGGAMGLWLGASILAILQLCDYCLVTVYTNCQCRGRCVPPLNKVDFKNESVDAGQGQEPEVVEVWTTPTTK